MFLVDDILLAPFHSFFWLFREIYNAAEQEVSNASEQITIQLSELYMMLETGQITDAEFDEQEAELLARLSALEEQATSDDDDDDDETDDEEEEDDDDDETDDEGD